MVLEDFLLGSQVEPAPRLNYINSDDNWGLNSYRAI
jgi:hypothetical protein